MNVYTVSGDAERYRSLEPMPGEPVPQYLADEQLGAGRAPARCRWVDPSLPAAPFISFLPTAFAIDLEAVDAIDVQDPDVFGLLSLCEMASNPHVLYVNGERDGERHRWAIDVITVANALDREGTVWDEGREGDYFAGIRRFAFRADRLGWGAGLFKLPVSEPCPVFAFDGVEGRSGELFMDRYRQCGASGLVFTKVWSNEYGA